MLRPVPHIHTHTQAPGLKRLERYFANVDRIPRELADLVCGTSLACLRALSLSNPSSSIIEAPRPAHAFDQRQRLGQQPALRHTSFIARQLCQLGHSVRWMPIVQTIVVACTISCYLSLSRVQSVYRDLLRAQRLELQPILGTDS